MKSLSSVRTARASKLEMDLLEFLDQYSLGRIQLIESLGFKEESN